MSVNTDSLGSEAAQFLFNPRFHHTFTLPASSNHSDDLTVSYADFGRAPGLDGVALVPTVLFMPGMFASRYVGIAINIHAIAEKLGVRVLVVDRPGIGKSTDVPLDKRVSIWIEIVSCLLEHLNIQHVALMSHCAGTIFLLNTLVQCRDNLHPTKPLVVLLAPWVTPDHSKVTSMQLARYVPVSAFSVWNLLPQFFVLNAGPVFASSGGIVTTASHMMSRLDASKDTSELEKNSQRIEKDYGMPRELQAQVEERALKSMFGENTVGANSEALQCLKKSNWSWGRCSDYVEFVKELVQMERTRKGNETDDSERQPLKVRAYFAENDSMIGKRGQQFVEECWSEKELGDVKDVLDFESTTVPNSNHDTLVGMVDVLEKVFIEAGGVPIGSTE